MLCSILIPCNRKAGHVYAHVSVSALFKMATIANLIKRKNELDYANQS